MSRVVAGAACVFFALCGLPPASAQSPEPEKFALIVAINKYAQPADKRYALSDLKGPENDAVRVKELLVQTYGFEADSAHIKELRGKDATRAGIEAAFRSQLIANAKAHPEAT